MYESKFQYQAASLALSQLPAPVPLFVPHNRLQRPVQVPVTTPLEAASTAGVVEARIAGLCCDAAHLPQRGTTAMYPLLEVRYCLICTETYVLLLTCHKERPHEQCAVLWQGTKALGANLSHAAVYVSKWSCQQQTVTTQSAQHGASSPDE